MSGLDDWIKRWASPPAGAVVLERPDDANRFETGDPVLLVPGKGERLVVAGVDRDTGTITYEGEKPDVFVARFRFHGEMFADLPADPEDRE